jgi:hypothetical protein
MILGASFSGMAAWLVLGEAKIRPNDSAWARGVHVVAGWLTLQGLAASQGEFSFGVPQFQQLFHPILVCLAAGFAFVAIRIVLGRFWAVGIATFQAVLMSSHLLSGNGSPVPTRSGGLYVVAALAVEGIAVFVGTERRLRFAVASGIGVGTIGLAGEFAWNAGARQPWNSNLLPDALILGVLVAVGSAILGAAFARAVAGDPLAYRVPRWAVALAGAAVLITLLLPMPRHVGDVRADVELLPAGEGLVNVRAVLTPTDAADHARWFQTVAWQGGTLVLAEMKETGPGEFITDRPVPIVGKGKVILRLHRGSEMNAFAIRIPGDAEIDKPEIPAVDRGGPFTHETDFLLRETTAGAGWYAYTIYGLLIGVAILWALAFRLAANRIGRPPTVDARQLVPA